MVDEYGKIVGVTGFGSDSFGFAISSDALQKSLKQMKKSPKIEYKAYPESSADKNASKQNEIKLESRLDSQIFTAFVEKKTEVTLSFPADSIPAVSVYDLDFEISKVNNVGFDIFKRFESFLVYENEDDYAEAEDEYEGDGAPQQFDELELNDKLKEVSPGNYIVKVPSKTYLYVEINTNNLDKAEFASKLTSNIPFVKHDVSTDANKIKVGTPKSFVMESALSQNVHFVELKKGVKYEIEVRSLLGDPSFVIFPKGGPLEEATYFDDSEKKGGIFGLDAVGTYTPKEDGVYDLMSGSDGTSLGYTVTVKKAKVKK